MAGTDSMEEVCAKLCLLTRAAWMPDLPSPITRREAHALFASGMLDGLVLRHADMIAEEKAERIRRLLSRARSVYELCRAYEEKGYIILLPRDVLWPEGLKRLGVQAPLFLFALGNTALLKGRHVAVAGSRSILPETAAASERLGRRMAHEGLILVTGGAQGVDSAAQRGVLEAGGSAILIPAMQAERMKETPDAHRALEEGRLLILCDTLPDEPFSPGKALARNHSIYSMGEAAVVMAARDGIGGSWRGAVDCIRGGWTPVFVPEDDTPDTAGCRRLEALGARRLAPGDKQRLTQALFAERQLDMFGEMP